MKNIDYNASAVQQLTFREGVRSRIGIYLGSADHTGVMAGLLELVNNATDEALVVPEANRIELVIGKDWASCRDYGRGIPHGPNSFSKEVLINLLTENHSGAKFNDNAYGGKSRGLNGTGSAATCCSSDWFKISSYRDGYEWYMEFDKGIPKWEECQKKDLNGQKRGTYIVYKPSQDVFKSEPIEFRFSEICEQMKEYSYFNKGIEFVVTNAETKETKKYKSENGLLDFAKEVINKPVHSTPLHIKGSENDIDVEIIMQWTGEKNEKFYLFSNGGENENGGTPITGIKTAITNFFKKRVKIEDNELFRTGLTYICSVNLKNPIYDGQTKSKITNPELKGLCQRLTGQVLEQFELKNNNEFNKVIELLTKVNKAEKAAERTRQAILNAEKELIESQKKKIVNVDKLRDARKLGQDSILLVAEGLSAGGSMSIGRDPEKYGILMLKGKLINLLSNTIEDGLDNEEVKLLQQALGIIYNKDYNPKKLRYGKIAIATDADADGSHIGLLIMAALQVLCPKFLQENRLYWLKAPIYKVSTKKKNYYYYSEEEFEGHPNGEIVRYKGLGQMSDQDLKESMFNNEWQRLEPITYSEEGIAALLELMGNNVEPRKEYVFNNIDFSEFNIG